VSVVSFVRKLCPLTGHRLRQGLTALLVLACLGVGAFASAHYVQKRYWEPRRHYRAATEALERRDFKGAEEHLAKCLEIWPDDAACQFLAARAARRAGDLDEAEKHLFACQHIEEATGVVSGGDTKLEWALLQARRGQLLDVEPYLRARLREGHPDSLLILEVLSWELMWSGRYREAGDSLNQWLQRQPNDYEALVRRAWVAEHLFDMPSALKDYKAALAIDPKQDQVRLRVAEILVSTNRAAQAVEDLDLLRQHQPGNPAVLLCQVRCLRQLGKSAEAQQVLDNFLAAHPNEAPALSERGLLALEMGHPAEGEQLLRQAATRDPSNRQVNYNLYQCLQRLGKKDEAQRLAAKLAQAEAEVKRMDQLIRNVMRKPYDPTLRYEVGQIFLRNGFTEDGLRWLDTALKADPQHRPTHEALANYFERSGEHERAELHRRFLSDTDRQ
jgi:tetratricopeptide (TPR) repeat protein